MNASRFFIAAIALALIPAASHAKGKPKGNAKPPASAQASAENPADALAPYIHNVDGLLALERQKMLGDAFARRANTS